MLKHFTAILVLLLSVLTACNAVAANTPIPSLILPNLDFNSVSEAAEPCPNVPLQTWSNCKAKASLFVTLNDTDKNNDNDTSNDFLTQTISPHPDWEGLKQDTKFFLFYQFFVIGVLFIMPEDLSGWSEEAKDTWGVQTYRKNLSHITWDADKSWINYFLHPYWGGTYYVRARNRGYDQRASVWYSVLLSTLYEFGSESLFERASAQDLIVTPLGGYFFGEYMMKARAKVQAKLAAKARPSFYDKTLLIATDPIGWINHKTARLMGKASKFSIKPISTLILPQTESSHAFQSQSPYTLSKETPSRVPMKLGLQFNLSW